jgi:hypothetical protein
MVVSTRNIVIFDYLWLGYHHLRRQIIKYNNTAYRIRYQKDDGNFS